MAVLGVVVRVGVRVGMRMRVLVVMPMVMPRAMLVFVLVLMVVAMIVPVHMRMMMVMSAYSYRAFPGQSASAIFTHYSISSEASSISRPPRSSPLGR